MRVTTPVKIGIVLASVREGRRGEAFAKWVQAASGGEIVDLREYPLPGYPYKDGTATAEKSYAAGSLEKRFADRIASFDAFIIVTPEYTHGYPGALKNALDHVYTPWNYKPVAFVSYGGFSAGTRAVEQLRLVAVELRMVPVRDEVNIRLVGYTADERGFPKDELYQRRLAAVVGELSWWARVAKDGRAANPR